MHLLSCICFVYFTYFRVDNVVSSNITTELSKTEQIFECISRVSENMEDMSTLVISSPSILNVTGLTWKNSKPTVLVTQNSTALLVTLQKTDLFILSFITLQEFSFWLKEVHLSEFWNPNGKFIISILQHDNMTEIFEVAWSYYIININLVFFNNDSVGVFTYYPYRSASCIINVTAELLFLCSDNIPNDLYPEKVPYNFNGCNIRILACVVPPYVIDYLANSKDPTKAGYEVTIFDTILTRLNLTQIYLKHTFPSWGSKLPNGTYSLMYGKLQERRADLVFGLAFLVYNSTDFEVLSQAIIDNVIWWVPSAGLRHPWANLLYVYTPVLWAFIIFSIFINGVLFWIFGIYKNLPVCVLASMNTFLQGHIKSPKTDSRRVLFAFWLMYCVILYAAHQSQLVSALTKPKYDEQISSLEEMLESGLQFGFFPTAAMFFQDPIDPTHRKIRTSFVSCPLNEECVNRTAFQRDFAVLKSKRPLLYLLPKIYLFPNGRPRLQGFGDGFMTYSRYVLVKGNPVIKRMNKILSLLFSSGLISKWQKDVTFMKRIPDKPILTPLSVAHLAVGFLYLFIGLALSTITFIIEIIRVKYQYKCK